MLDTAFRSEPFPDAEYARVRSAFGMPEYTTCVIFIIIRHFNASTPAQFQVKFARHGRRDDAHLPVFFMYRRQWF